MTALEERLRSELRTEAELITPESIVPLRLPTDTGRVPDVPRRGGARRRPPWTIPLAAAAAAAAAIVGTFAFAHLLPRPAPGPAGTKLASVPAYYAYAVQGSIYHYVSHGTEYGESVNGRYLKVRDTATGKLLASISPPRPYNDFQLISANAAGTMFVLGAAHNWDRNAHTPVRVTRRDPRTPLKFWELRVSPGARPHLSSLSLPATVTPAQVPSIALSPDGSRLAMAFGGGGRPAVLEVISLGTGGARRWVSPPVPWTPALSLTGAWTADGKTLALQQEDVVRTVSRQAALRWRPPVATPVYLIDTLTPGGSLSAGKLLRLRAPAHNSAPWQVFLTPDGTKLIGATGKRAFPPLRGTSTGELAVYSAQTGAMLQRLAPWTWRGIGRTPGDRFPNELLALSSSSGGQLILLYPWHGQNTLGVLTAGRFRTTGAPLPGPAGYQELQYALRTASQVAW